MLKLHNLNLSRVHFHLKLVCNNLQSNWKLVLVNLILLPFDQLDCQGQMIQVSTVILLDSLYGGPGVTHAWVNIVWHQHSTHKDWSNILIEGKFCMVLSAWLLSLNSIRKVHKLQSACTHTQYKCKFCSPTLFSPAGGTLEHNVQCVCDNIV